jgi:hypothetical protein
MRSSQAVRGSNWSSTHSSLLGLVCPGIALATTWRRTQIQRCCLDAEAAEVVCAWPRGLVCIQRCSDCDKAYVCDMGMQRAFQSPPTRLTEAAD